MRGLRVLWGLVHVDTVFLVSLYFSQNEIAVTKVTGRENSEELNGFYQQNWMSDPIRWLQG